MFGRPQLVLALLLLLAALFWWRQPEPDSQARTALIMGTLVEIHAAGESAVVDQAIGAAFAEMRRIEALFSPHLPESELSRLSHAATPVQVSSEVAALLRQGQDVARRTAGAFDCGLGALKQLWGIESEAPQVPTADEVARALRGTGPEAVQIEGSLVRKADPGLQLDLGGIAKGYAVDRALQVLKKAEISSASINAGGDIGLLGAKEDGSLWRIGIQHPRQPGQLLTTLLLRNRAVVTSGDYERFFERDGIRYHHIFDPRSGQPARGCQSVTVVAADAATADALATAAFVLGPAAGRQLLENWPQVEGLLVAADGALLRTSGLAELER